MEKRGKIKTKRVGVMKLGRGEFENEKRKAGNSS